MSVIRSRWGRSACPRRSPSWPPGSGTSSSSVVATTVWRAPPISPRRVGRCWCSNAASASGAPARSSSRSAILASPSARAPTSSGCSIRWVIDELDLRRHGYKVFLADPALWCPFDDGTWYGQFLDHERTAAGMRENGFSEADIKGQFEYEDFFDRMRRALRERVRDTWVGPSPDEDELRELLGTRSGADRRAVRDVDRRRRRTLRRRPSPAAGAVRAGRHRCVGRTAARRERRRSS